MATFDVSDPIPIPESRSRVLMIASRRDQG